MTMSEYNTTVAQDVVTAIADVGAGTCSLAGVVRLAEADLEEIKFTTLLDEQVPAIFRSDDLRTLPAHRILIIDAKVIAATSAIPPKLSAIIAIFRIPGVPSGPPDRYAKYRIYPTGNNHAAATPVAASAA